METIGREELKAKLDRGDTFKLVMTLNEWAYEAQHIPGSINVSNFADLEHSLSPDDEIVVYCSDIECIASQVAYKILKQNGFDNVRRYAGGLSDWYAAGYALDGDGL